VTGSFIGLVILCLDYLQLQQLSNVEHHHHYKQHVSLNVYFLVIIARGISGSKLTAVLDRQM
jgi:hypothetical protein